MCWSELVLRKSNFFVSHLVIITLIHSSPSHRPDQHSTPHPYPFKLTSSLTPFTQPTQHGPERRSEDLRSPTGVYPGGEPKSSCATGDLKVNRHMLGQMHQQAWKQALVVGNGLYLQLCRTLS